jgi:hypothetical protein
MRHTLSLLLLFIGIALQAQPGKVTLGAYCGDDHKSPTREIEKGLRAINMATTPMPKYISVLPCAKTKAINTRCISEGN